MSGKVRVGIIGLGMGMHHLKCFKANEDCEVTAIAELNEEKLNQVCDEYEIPHRFTQGEAMITSGEVDMVAIVTPNFTHHPLAMTAIEQGLHVLCEKPLAVNAQQAQQMVDTAAAKGVKFGMHFNHRMAAPVQILKSYVDAGDFGDIYFARTIWHRRMGIPAGAAGWFYNMDQSGGGAMIDLGVHMMDQVMSLMGYPKVISVTGMAHTKFAEEDLPGKEMNVDDFATAYVRLEGNRSLAVEISWACHHEKAQDLSFSIYGEKAGAVRRGGDITIHRREHGRLVDVKIDPGKAKYATVQDDFIAAIQEDRDPVCAGWHGLEMMKILDGIYESSKTGREVRFDGE